MALLEIRDVTVRYGGHVALREVTLGVEAGRVTGLIGPNGAGKTTLFNVLTGLLTPGAGRVLLDGEDVTRLAPYRRARRGMARTFQILELFGQLTALENVALATRLRRRTAAGERPDPGALLERVGLSAFADRRADTLPTGLGRRLELARALAVRPRVLLLDEPASGQDPDETAAFADLLGELADEGLAILLVEHDMTLVMRVCAHLYVLDFGTLMAEGDPASVRADPRVREAYLGTSTGTDPGTGTAGAGTLAR
ncbi:ABC transporter ATP-binding protein [Frankia sp. CNm7]|uniref:ABC transporter ATP-binding protein n=1 Tax=Frankia nepalensis TaxID=1836974 RepID=A0A937ULT4_9ACTN|nr:ABC transporter ATP-binding protein [Frankia nepalensis]MBL7501759.1 ABC transporter ATP-binding protein [Frankia nepalensis]MBL7513552.1 ABC transporter ATP-binding protein [Frankia nepalensis]MBL7518003.1 ABC transporter ATP-binding protein [Frankia nepalensis]MBL7628184.1 ABC transporter ATP-binding protein [Frankia nepalensis]